MVGCVLMQRNFLKFGASGESTPQRFMEVNVSLIEKPIRSRWRRMCFLVMLVDVIWLIPPLVFSRADFLSGLIAWIMFAPVAICAPLLLYAIIFTHNVLRIETGWSLARGVHTRFGWWCKFLTVHGRVTPYGWFSCFLKFSFFFLVGAWIAGGVGLGITRGAAIAFLCVLANICWFATMVLLDGFVTYQYVVVPRGNYVVHDRSLRAQR